MNINDDIMKQCRFACKKFDEMIKSIFRISWSRYTISTDCFYISHVYINDNITHEKCQEFLHLVDNMIEFLTNNTKIRELKNKIDETYSTFAHPEARDERDNKIKEYEQQIHDHMTSLEEYQNLQAFCIEIETKHLELWNSMFETARVIDDFPTVVGTIKHDAKVVCDNLDTTLDDFYLDKNVARTCTIKTILKAITKCTNYTSRDELYQKFITLATNMENFLMNDDKLDTLQRDISYTKYANDDVVHKHKLEIVNYIESSQEFQVLMDMYAELTVVSNMMTTNSN